MRNTIKNLMIVVLTAIGISCADESLSPLQFDKVKKGTLLALRGPQLDAIYFDEQQYGQAFFANALTGDEAFEYDAEFLSADLTSLSGVDIFVIKRTVSGTDVTKERIALTSIPFSAFKTTEDYRGPWVAVSLPLTDILAKIGVDLSTPANVADFYDVYADGIQMESDLNLTNGTQVTNALLVAAGLYESDQFYPAQRLTYGVEDIDDARPVATLSQRGQYSSSTGKHTVLPLKNGATDTLNIIFDQDIDVPPTVTINPVSGGTLGTLVAVTDKPNQFYIPFTAGPSYTGTVDFIIAGATSAEAGALAGLEMSSTTNGIKGMAVDNLAPFNTSFSTGTRLGKGQSATITLKFNEALGTAPTVTITPGSTGIDGVTDVKTTLSTDGLTATYTYEYKDLDGNATHGDATVSVSGGSDKAGNAVPAITSKSLTVDIGAAPAPAITLDGSQYDWGTQIKWTMTYAIGGSNPGGATSGTVYFVAQTAGSAPPTGFVGGDVPGFILANGVSAKQTGTVAITSGTSGSVFSAFTPNGSLDVYAVIITSSGVISSISAATNVTMN